MLKNKLKCAQRDPNRNLQRDPYRRDSHVYVYVGEAVRLNKSKSVPPGERQKVSIFAL